MQLNQQTIMKLIDFELTKASNSIEELFAKHFDECYKIPMDNETSEIFMKLTLLKDIDLDIPEEEKPFIYKLIEKRISVIHDFKLDDKVLMFLSFICESAGVGVMYVWYLQYQCKKRNTKFISFSDFTEIFSWGFPSKDTLDKLWSSQKVDVPKYTNNSDNLLDYKQAGLSLF